MRDEVTIAYRVPPPRSWWIEPELTPTPVVEHATITASRSSNGDLVLRIAGDAQAVMSAIRPDLRDNVLDLRGVLRG